MDNFIKEFMVAIIIGSNIGLGFALYFSPAEFVITAFCMIAYLVLDFGLFFWLRKNNNP